MDGHPRARRQWIHEEALVDLPVAEEHLPAVSKVRGSLLIASRDHVGTMREVTEAYEAALDRADLAALQKCMPSEWVPVELAVAHYAALDALRLSIGEVRQIGEWVARRVHDSPFFPLFRLAMSAGATPAAALVQMPRLWTRMFVGGGVGIMRAGPKDVLVRAYKNPLFHSAYFRHAAAGHVRLAAQVFATQAYVKMMPQVLPESCSYRVSWA
jgi:hypothetical protein